MIEYMHYFLKQVLCKSVFVFLNQVQRSNSHDDGTVRDLCDSQQYKQHPLFSAHPRNLQIELYYDDVEFCNPFCSYCKKHKLG